MKEEDGTKTDRIHFNQNKSRIVLNSPHAQLSYLMLSTEPGRKIIHPPHSAIDSLSFEVEKSDGINESTENFCAVGLSNCFSETAQIIEKSSGVKILNKSIYISKVKIGFKPSLFSQQHESLTRNKKCSLNFHPPTDLNAHEIQPILEKFQKKYGTASKIDIKRNCLVLSYEKQVEIDRNFKIRKLKISENGENVLAYWAITSHRPLFTFEPIQLIQLPSSTIIFNLTLQGDWLVFSTRVDVIFLHMYRPLELFLTLPDITAQGIQPLNNSRVIILEYKYIHVYQLYSNKNPLHLGTGKTKKIQAYSIAICKNTAVVGGLNYSYMLNEPTCEKQLHVFENFSNSVFHNKMFYADKTVQICKKEQKDPIKNLTYMEDLNLFFCSCKNSIYVFHLETQSLIASVDLNSAIKKIYEIQYPINLINILVFLKEGGKPIRVSFEQHCEIMGTEVNQIDNLGEPKDIMACVGKRKNIYLTDGELIVQFYNNCSTVLYSCEQNNRVKKISVHQEALAFVTENSESCQVFFQEI